MEVEETKGVNSAYEPEKPQLWSLSQRNVDKLLR